VTLLTLVLPADTTRPRPANATAPGDTTNEPVWQPVCPLADIVPNTGVCALMGAQQIALVRFGTGAEVYAIGNFDPFSKAFVLARGIVGDKSGVPKIASPIYKQCFDLRTGQCLDDPNVTVPVWPVRVRNGQVEVALK
jgi:nitrite reductase (NADH) small subunit